MPLIQVKDLSAPELLIYSGLTQAQLKNRKKPEKGLFIAESLKVVIYALNAGYEPVSMLMEEKQANGQAKELIARCPEIPVYIGRRETLAALTGYELTRGILAAFHRKPMKSVEQICANASRIAVLEGIVDASNAGAIFRSAAALGMDAVVLAPTCCDPLYRKAVRVSMGTVFQVPWTRIGETAEDWPEKGLKQLKALGFKTVSLALTDRSVSITDEALKKEEKLAMILGSEGNGLSAETVAMSDYTVKIPMAHGVDSLNVAAAGAVAFWELGKH